MEKIRPKLQNQGKMKKLSWTDSEKLAFDNVKLAASEAMETGIERLIKQESSSNNPLVLTSDWSKKGTGFQLHLMGYSGERNAD